MVDGPFAKYARQRKPPLCNEDEIVWLDDEEEHAEWYDALRAVERGDKAPLIQLLKAQSPPPSIAFYIGDLLERYGLKQPKARPRLPAYERSPQQRKMIAGILSVRMRVKQGKLLARALQDVAAELGLEAETLSAAYQGKHGGLRRQLKHWHPPISR